MNGIVVGFDTIDVGDSPSARRPVGVTDAAAPNPEAAG